MDWASASQWFTRSACACLIGASLWMGVPSRPARADSLGTLKVRVLGGRNPTVHLVRDGRSVGTRQLASDGTFLISGVPAGPHTLLVRGHYCGPVERPVSVRAGLVDSIDVDLPCSPVPCPKLDRRDPGCIRPSQEERARVGKACQIHPDRRLRLDVVPIHYGIASFHPGAGNVARQFPNANMVSSMGCMVQVERWTEVAYCPECRIAFYWHNPRYLLHPIQPAEVEAR